MTKQDVIDIAAHIAAENGWKWLPPINARKVWRLFRSSVWQVKSNCECRGCNVCVDVNDQDGTILKAVFLPR